MEEQILKLPEYGVVGVIFALILVIVLLVGIIYKIVSNHINHNTESNIQLATSLTSLGGVIKDSTECTKELKTEINLLRQK